MKHTLRQVLEHRSTVPRLRNWDLAFYCGALQVEYLEVMILPLQDKVNKEVSIGPHSQILDLEIV